MHRVGDGPALQPQIRSVGLARRPFVRAGPRRSCRLTGPDVVAVGYQRSGEQSDGNN